MLADKKSLETMIFQVGSKVFTHKPRANDDSDVEEVEGEGDSLNEITPCQQGIEQCKASTGTGPYEMPVILQTKHWALSVVQVENTEAEDSEIEREVIGKRKKAIRVSSQVPSVLLMTD